MKASTSHDAFFGQGFATSQDRLWQMEYDRRRAYGRWAEYVGPEGVEQDAMMRRFRLLSSALRDYEALDAGARAMVDAFAEGRQRLHRQHPLAASRVRHRRVVPREVGAVGLPGGLQGAPLP